MWYNLCWKFAARFRATDPAGPWTACFTAAVRSLYELVIRHCGVTGKLTFCCGHGCCPLHGVLAGAGPGAAGGPASPPPARRPQPWAVFLLTQGPFPAAKPGIFAQRREKDGKSGPNRKILLYNGGALCYSNLVRGGAVCPPPPSLASPGGDTCPRRSLRRIRSKGGKQP